MKKGNTLAKIAISFIFIVGCSWLLFSQLEIGKHTHQNTNETQEPVDKLEHTERIEKNPLAIQESGIKAAKAWLSRHGVEIEELQAMPIDERAKRLNQAIYSFCTVGATPSDINELFYTCTTTCSGYTYVLRALIESTGVETRSARLYNIPNQGNHVGVEVKSDDKWLFFDPTFGNFFSENGEPNGQPLSLYEVASQKSPAKLASLVQQGRRTNDDFIRIPLSSLYSEKFEHEYMPIENYIVAEHISPNKNGSLLVLDIPLTIQNGQARIGTIKPGADPAGEKAWLNDTNATLNDQDPLNDVSFLTSMIYNDYELTRVTSITLYNLKPKKSYKMTLYLSAINSQSSELEIASIGKGTKFESRSGIKINANSELVYEDFFTPQRTSAQFYVKNLENSKLVRLFGVEIYEE